MSDKKKIYFGTVCCVPGCKNSKRFSRNLSWHTFPADPKTRKEWIRRVNRVGLSGKFSTWCPTPHDRICGAHFNKDGKKKYEEKLPTIFAHKTYATKYFEDDKHTTAFIMCKSLFSCHNNNNNSAFCIVC